MKKVILLLLAGSVLTFSSCTKTGPAGPQGPAGANGNANVIGSNPFSVSSWDFSSHVYSATFTDNDLSSSVVNNGLVEIYKQYPDGSWTNLPDIDGITSTVYNFYQGGFVISILNSDGSNPSAPGTISFRTVIVPSSVRLAHPNTNWKNYNDAMAALADKAAPVAQ